MHDDGPRSTLPIFREYPALRSRLPWLSLGHWPTPVQEAKNFARDNGLRSFWLKREDLSHPHGAGNKVRGLEFLLAHAKQRQARTILTLSSAGSHHICKTAWHARQIGIDTTAFVLHQPPQPYVAANLLLNAQVGARILPANVVTIGPRLLAAYLRDCMRRPTRRPYLIGPGGTSPRSCVGHVNAVFELRDQIRAGLLPEPDYIYVAMGSLGTAAGLALGCRLAGLKATVVGVAVSYLWYCTVRRCLRFARRTDAMLRSHDASIPVVAFDSARIHVERGALGEGYACPTAESSDWAGRFRASESIRLDETYTAKTLHGAMDFIRREGAQNACHLFWHTYHAVPMREDLTHLIASMHPALRRYF